MQRVQRAYVDYGPKANALGLPVYALILLVLFRRQAFRYPDHLVFALHYVSLYFCVSIATTGISAVAPSWLSALSGIAVAVFVWIWLFFALRAVYQRSRIGTLLREIGFVISVAIVQAVLTSGMIFLAIWNA
jgi:hypothetical protein